MAENGEDINEVIPAIQKKEDIIKIAKTFFFAHICQEIIFTLKKYSYCFYLKTNNPKNLAKFFYTNLFLVVLKSKHTFN